MPVNTQINIRRDTAANFTSANPTLALGEIAYETDTGNIKVGTGSAAWTALAYINPSRGNAVAPVSNVVLGPSAGAAMQSGATDNVCIGSSAGDLISTGDNNVVIGSGADVVAATNANSIVIGQGAVGQGSNTTVIGNSSTTGTFIPAGDLILSGSTQQILVGTATAPADDIKLQVQRDADAKIAVVSPISGGVANASVSLNASTQGSWVIQAGSAASAGLRFYDINAGGGSERIRFDASGNIDLKAGNVIVTSGKGIDFSATANGSGTMTSELLSDYEEGTWTPQYHANTIDFTTLPTMNNQTAKYVKVGNVVTLAALVSTDSVNTTGASGLIVIRGLPYTPASRGGVSPGYRESWTNAPDHIGITQGVAQLVLYKRSSLTGASVNTSAADMVAGASSNQNMIIFCLSYLTI